MEAYFSRGSLLTTFLQIAPAKPRLMNARHLSILIFSESNFSFPIFILALSHDSLKSGTVAAICKTIAKFYFVLAI